MSVGLWAPGRSKAGAQPVPQVRTSHSVRYDGELNRNVKRAHAASARVACKLSPLQRKPRIGASAAEVGFS